MQSKKIIEKSLINSKLLKNYASWMYCNKCNNTVGYLCYTTYKFFEYEFECKCGNQGVVKISLEEINEPHKSDDTLQLFKNRFCCPKDDSPLFSVVDKNVNNYRYSLICRNCNSIYRGSK
jgi:hypothetical protein